jgi:hypothetical protein
LVTEIFEGKNPSMTQVRQCSTGPHKPDCRVRPPGPAILSTRMRDLGSESLKMISRGKSTGGSSAAN